MRDDDRHGGGDRQGDDDDTCDACDVMRRHGCASSSMLSQGAEGRVYAVRFANRDAVCKQRFRKRYRHPTLDEKLTKARLNMEARTMIKARKCGVLTPNVLCVDADECCVYM